VEGRTGAQDLFRAYVDAVHTTYAVLARAFVAPDLATGVRSTAYWNLLRFADAQAARGGFFADAISAGNAARASRAENQALSAEINNQVRALERAATELCALKELAKRPDCRLSMTRTCLTTGGSLVTSCGERSSGTRQRKLASSGSLSHCE
jgi:hypothetical protein